MTNKELQEAINQTFEQVARASTGSPAHATRAREHLEDLRRIQLDRAKEGLYE